MTALQNRTIILITSKAAKTFSVKSEAAKVKVPKAYAFGTLVRLPGFEPGASPLGGERSILLSYKRIQSIDDNNL